MPLFAGLGSSVDHRRTRCDAGPVYWSLLSADLYPILFSPTLIEKALIDLFRCAGPVPHPTHLEWSAKSKLSSIANRNLGFVLGLLIDLEPTLEQVDGTYRPGQVPFEFFCH